MASEALTSLQDALSAVADALEGRAYALVGGLAVSVHGEARMTRDVDVAVACESDAAAETLVFDLQQRGWRVFGVLEHEATGRLSTGRLSPPGPAAGTVIDLLFESSGIEREIASRASNVELLPELTLPVAARSDLIAMKVLSHDADSRPKNRDDLRGLLAPATDDDLSGARAALSLIEARSCHRGKRLQGELDHWVALFGPRP